MSKTQFIDYYEMLECSPNASLATIERLFRHLAKEFHPDVADSGDAKRLGELVEIFQILRDPEKRAEYDREFACHKSLVPTQSEAESVSMNDTDERSKLLAALYAKRRANMKVPGVSQSSLAEQSGCDESAIEFHLWYFLQKGWVQREESGVLSITAAGVDRIDEINFTRSQNGRLRIES